MKGPRTGALSYGAKLTWGRPDASIAGPESARIRATSTTPGSAFRRVGCTALTGIGMPIDVTRALPRRFPSFPIAPVQERALSRHAGVR